MPRYPIKKREAAEEKRKQAAASSVPGASPISSIVTSKPIPISPAHTALLRAWHSPVITPSKAPTKMIGDTLDVLGVFKQ